MTIMMLIGSLVYSNLSRKLSVLSLVAGNVNAVHGDYKALEYAWRSLLLISAVTEIDLLCISVVFGLGS